MNFKTLGRDCGKYLLEILDDFERPTGQTVFVDDKGLEAVKSGEVSLVPQPPIGVKGHDGSKASHVLAPLIKDETDEMPEAKTSKKDGKPKNSPPSDDPSTDPETEPVK
jgi:hypothetical protein